MRHIVLITGLLAIALLAACAAKPAWQKPGGNKQIYSQDTAACFRGASIRAERQMAKRGAATSPQIELRSSVGRVHDVAGAARKSARMEETARRNRIYSECMHRLGYRKNNS
jgi:hypothetical protein